MDEIDYDKGFINLKKTTDERIFTTCKYCLPHSFDEDMMKETARIHGIEVIYLSCDKHNPYAFGK